MMRIETIIYDELRQVVKIDGDLWNQQAISPGNDGGLICGETGITTKQAEQYGLTMRPCGRAITVDEFCRAIDRCLETNTIIGTGHIIIHCFGNAPDWYPLG